MPDQQRENLMRIDERTVAVDRADAAAVAIGAKAGIVFSGAHRLAQRFNVRFDGLRMDAPKAGIARAADFVAGNAVAFEKFWEKPSGRAVHGISHKAKLRVAHALPVHQLLDGGQIRSARVERLD